MDCFYSSLGQKSSTSGAVGNNQIITSLILADSDPLFSQGRVDNSHRTSFSTADGTISGMSHLPHLQPQAG